MWLVKRQRALSTATCQSFVMLKAHPRGVVGFLCPSRLIACNSLSLLHLRKEKINRSEGHHQLWIVNEISCSLFCCVVKHCSFVVLFHCVYIIQQTIWSVLTWELSACHTNIGCLCATYQHTDESSRDKIFYLVILKEVTAAWKRCIDTHRERKFIWQSKRTQERQYVRQRLGDL